MSRSDDLALFVAASLIAKLLLARYYMLGTTFGLGAFIDACAIVAAVAACSLVPGHARRVLMTSLAVLLPMVMLLAVLYSSYFGELPNIGMLRVSGQLASTSEATGHLLWWGYVLFVIDWPILLFAPGNRRLLPPSSWLRTALVGTLALLPPLAATAIGAALPDGLDAADYSSYLGLVAYEASPLLPSVTSASAQAITLQGRIDALTGHSPSAARRPGAPAYASMRGKNVIVIQMESLQAGLIGARVGTQRVVPNLEKLVKESIYFPNAYSQIGRGNTSDAEFVANTSLYPSKDEPSAVEYAKKSLPSLPRLLAEQGYETITMHTNEVSFWNRDQLYPALGFETVYDKSYFGDDEWAGFGASDHVLYDRGLPLLTAAGSEKRPFFAQIITVSAHYPFTNTGGESPLELPEEMANTETGNYLKAQSYADAQLGKFIKKLKSSGLLEDTVLVIYGDHFGMRLDSTPEDKKLREELFGHPYNASDFYNVPIIIRLPDGKPIREDAVVGQIDIMPTLSDLLGLDISRMPHFGQSAFVDSPTLLTRASSVETYITDDVAFFRGLTKGDGSFSPSTHEPLSKGGRPKNVANTRALVKLSEGYALSLPDRGDAADSLGRIPSSAGHIEDTPYR